MFALHEPGPEHHSGRQSGLPLGLIDHWAQLAVDRPWRYAATGAIGIGGANLGLRMLLNDVSLARNTGMAILYAVGFSVFAWLYPMQRTRPAPAGAVTVCGQACWPRAELRGSLALRDAGPPFRRRGRPPVWAALAMPTTWGAIGQIGRTTTNSNRAPGRRLVLAAVAVTAVTVALLVAAVANSTFLLKGVAMWLSQAGGLEGHQWRLQRTSGTRLPCRILCECGWTSTAGPETSVLLELKGHLEDSLHHGARLPRTQGQPPAKSPNTRST